MLCSSSLSANAAVGDAGAAAQQKMQLPLALHTIWMLALHLRLLLFYWKGPLFSICKSAVAFIVLMYDNKHGLSNKSSTVFIYTHIDDARFVIAQIRT